MFIPSFEVDENTKVILQQSHMREQCELYHSRRRNVDAGDGARANVIGQVTQHDAVHERGAEVFGKHDLQPALDALERRHKRGALRGAEESTGSTAENIQGPVTDGRQRAPAYLSELLHELQLLPQLLHLPPHGELRIHRLQALVAPQEHCGKSNRNETGTRVKTR